MEWFLSHLAGIIIGIIVGGVVTGVLVWMLRPSKIEFEVARRAEEVKTVSEFSNILVPTLGTLFSERMIALACKFAKIDGASVTALYIVELPMTLPPDVEIPPRDLEKGNEVLEEAKVIAKKFDIKIKTKIEKARVAGKAIVDLATREGFDLIVCSAPDSKDRKGRVYGRTVDYIFRQAPCDVIIEKPAFYIEE